MFALDKTGISLQIYLVHPENEYSFKRCCLFLVQYVVMFMGSFLRFRASRPGHFKELWPGEASPLPVPLDFARGQGVPQP